MDQSPKNPGMTAFEFAKRGWPVLPLHYPAGSGCSCKKDNCSSVGKHPITKNGLKDASSGQATILKWWKDSPQANVGILTGKISGLVVLDIDPRHGGDNSLEQLEQEHGRLPDTLKVRTGGNGWHYYFKHPGIEIKNKANILPGLDLRGDGGYVVAPPSLHASQQTYHWDGDTTEICKLPDWLMQLIRNPIAKKIVPSMPTQGFPEGGRNSGLLSVAGFLKSKGMDAEGLQGALSSLNQALCKPPLEESEVIRIALSLGRYKEKTWEPACRLPQEPVAQPLTPDMLPTPLKNWCQDISERMQVALEFAAGPAIVAIASTIGRKMVVQPKIEDTWQVVPNLWGMLVAPPGSMKSPVMSAVLKPLQNLAVKARDKYVEDLKKMEASKTVAKAEIDALKDALKHAIKQGKNDQIAAKKKQLEEALQRFEEEFDLPEKRFMMNDPTIEKLLTILQENPQGLLLYRDEISGWMETMYKSGREGDREFFLEAWNGDSPYSMDRISRGSIYVDGLCLSVLGGLQPTKFQSYVSSIAKGGKSDDGLIQRFQMLLQPEKRTSWRDVDRTPDKNAEQKAFEIFEKLADLPDPKRTDDGIERLSL